jgi:hypothetical protein
MTLSDTVSSFAHEAASTATDIGAQAFGLGSRAAELGSDAAEAVASAAEHLADSLSKKAGNGRPKRHTMRWIIIVGGAATVGAVAFAKTRNRPATTPPTSHHRLDEEDAKIDSLLA